MDRKFVIASLIYALLGLALGIVMAASKNHGQLVTHAHLMLVGFVVSFIYGVCHKLWLSNSTRRLARIQFYVHQIGTFFLLLGLFLLYGRFGALEILDPLLAVASILVFMGVVLMMIMFLRANKSTT